MKLNQKVIQYVLLLLIVIIAVGAYQFGYVKYIEKADAVKEENKQIEARINELNEKEAHREEWTTGIENSAKEIKQILAKYGPGNTPQKSIMFITGLEAAAGMNIGSIGFSSNNTIYSDSYVDENGDHSVEMNSTSVAVSYNTTYEGLKACMDYINSYPERMNVQNFSSTFDQENAQLTGSMTINMYGVKDEYHVYSEPTVGGIDIGTDNIFGTIDLNSIIDALSGTELGGEEGTENGTGAENTGETQTP